MIRAKTLLAGLALCVAAALVPGLATPVLEAQGPARALTDEQYDRLRALTDQLEELAAYAADPSEHPGSPVFRRDRLFVTRTRVFDRRLERFARRLDVHAVRPFRIDAELDLLRSDAERVRQRLDRVGEDELRQEWDRVVELVDQIAAAYRQMVAGTPPSPSPVPWASMTRLDELAAALSAASAEARATAGREGPRGLYDALTAFERSVHEFQRGIPSRNLTIQTAQPAVAELARVAEDRDRDLRRLGASRSLERQWDAVMGILRRLQSLAPPVPTPPPPAVPPAPGSPEEAKAKEEMLGLSHELEIAATRAAQLAEARPGADDALRHFRDEAWTFHRVMHAGQAEMGTIRRTLAHLLEDARAVEAEVAREGSDPALVREWAAVARLLERMRVLTGI